LTSLSDEIAVEVKGISYFYGDRTALGDVSMNILRGEMFGVVGPNGSGKSTLFRILATLLPPARGTACVLGESVTTRAKQVRGKIGVVFQDSILDGKLTLKENLIHHGHLYGMWGKALRRRVDELLAMTRLEERRNDRVETLSGGLRRRGELAECLMHGPPVLLLDEPTVGLDPVARREFWEDVGNMQAARELTVLLSTHLMDEADRCDRLLLLREGEVFALASPDDLKRKMGYDIITVRTERAEQLVQAILSKFDLNPNWEDDSVRVEIVDGHRWVGRLMDSFGEDIESITVSKPSIEDVMLFRKDGPDESDNST